MDNLQKFYSAITTLKSGTQYTVDGDMANENDFNNNVQWVTGENNGTAITTGTCPHSEITWTKVKEEMVTMYKIVMNDADETEISKDQPLLNMVRFNIGIMLMKFKAMSDSIINLKKENDELKQHFNIMIELIKGCDTDEKLQKLKSLDKLD